MLLSIDRAGPVGLPKALRVALGITADTQLELIPDGSGLLTDDDVRRLRDDQWLRPG